MILTIVIGDCPKCGHKDSFGNSYITSNHVQRGCKVCPYRETVRLPKIQKKVLYLDQFFYSSAFRGNDKRFVDAVDRIKRISSLQLLAVPFSSIHEDETHQWSGFERFNKKDLLAFIKGISRGHSFKPAWDVQKTQIFRSFKAFLAGKSLDLKCELGDVLDNKIHDWDDYMYISSNIYVGDVEKIREFKRMATENLVGSFDDWRKSNTAFDDDAEFEIKGYGKAYIGSFIDNHKNFLDPSWNPLNVPIMSTVVLTMGKYFPEDTSWDLKWPQIARFFDSEHFATIPYQRLSARIFAAFRHEIKQGKYTNREKAWEALGGFYYDLDFIATFAPYCDAMFIDKSMAGLIADKRIGIQKFPVKIFSASKWEELYTWLDALEANMSEEHKKGLSAIYPA